MPVDPAVKELAQGKNFAALTVHLPSGHAATQIMWIDADDDHLLINTEVHRAKYTSIVASPQVTIAIWDSESPYRYAEVRGTLVGEVRGPEARAHIDACSQRYLGADYQPAIQSERVILQIAPLRQRTNGLG